MSREIRKVPSNWVHPSEGHYSDGEVKYTPLYDGATYHGRVSAWDEDKAKWDSGEFPSFASEESKLTPFEEWDGKRPDIKDYMPCWPEEERTHFMLYSTTSEGTPKSPAFATVEELARWLTDNNVSTHGYNRPTTYENWLAFCKEGSTHGTTFAIAVTSSGTETVSGVDLVSRKS